MATNKIIKARAEFRDINHYEEYVDEIISMAENLKKFIRAAKAQKLKQWRKDDKRIRKEDG